MKFRLCIVWVTTAVLIGYGWGQMVYSVKEIHAAPEPKLDAPKIVREQPKPRRIHTVIGLTAFADGRAGVQVLEIDGHHYIFTVSMGNNPNINAMHAESCPCKKQKAWVD
jgi:hypothetical protein